MDGGLLQRLEHEQLDREIGVDVDRAHIGDHLPTGGILDDPAELVLHRGLEAATHLVIGFTSATSIEDDFVAEIFKLRW